MEQNLLISKLQELKEIKPGKAWVSSVKKEVFKDNGSLNVWESFTPGFVFKSLAYASLSVLMVVTPVLVAAQYSLPGSPLFGLKKITEYSKAALMPGVDQSKHSLVIANKRLSDLSAIVSTQQKENISQGIHEFKQSVSNMAYNLDKDDRPALQQIAIRVESLGAMMNNGHQGFQLNSALAPLVLKEISDLEDASLTPGQRIKLEEIKEMYEEGEFSFALENLLLISK